MRILHLFSSKVFAGLERHLEELSYEQRHSHKIYVVGPESLKENFRIEYKVLDTNQWRHSPILLNQTKTIINSIGPDVVHTHGSKMTSIVNKIKDLNLHVSTIHGTKKDISPFEKTDFIFGASKKSLEKISSSNSMVLENWVDESRFSGYSKSESEYFLYLGRFEPVKNPKRLINAWKDMNHKLIMVGEGALKGEMQNLIKDLNLSNQISLKSETNNIAELFSKAKALIIPSNREGSPKVLFESLFCNVPVLSTRCGIMSDILPPTSLAEIDDENFKNLLSQWVNNIDELKTMQEVCFKKVKQENLLSIQAEKVNKVYQDLFSKVSK
tara:strand:+ start:3544 stop:4524 length:981 start_codon:yes stop_codon:yes gene_type:complete